jgi:hypothetical protein
MRDRLATGVLLLAAGCARQTPPALGGEPVTASVTISAPVARTWDRVVDHFAERSVPIRTIERASGLIVTLETPVGREGARWADCGRDFDGATTGPTMVWYNVRVQGDSTTSTLRITARFTNPRSIQQVCVSTGIHERELGIALKARVEGRSARPD